MQARENSHAVNTHIQMFIVVLNMKAKVLSSRGKGLIFIMWFDLHSYVKKSVRICKDGFCN